MVQMLCKKDMRIGTERDFDEILINNSKFMLKIIEIVQLKFRFVFMFVIYCLLHSLFKHIRI